MDLAHALSPKPAVGVKDGEGVRDGENFQELRPWTDSYLPKRLTLRPMAAAKCAVRANWREEMRPMRRRRRR